MIPNEQMGNLQDLFLTNIMNGGTGSTLRLFTNNVLPDPTFELGDFDEANFDGYTADGPHTDWFKGVDTDVGRGSLYLPAPLSQFVSGATNLPQVIYGYYVESSTGLLACAERLKHPITLAQSGDVFIVDSHFTFNASIQDNPA